MNITNSFFDSGPFMPHGNCYLWSKWLVTLHVLSDTLIVLAYYSIPITLVYFVRKRKDIQFHWMFVCFALFILACGTTHLMEIWNIWHANYWLSGGIKALTALASVPTAILLVKLVPHALALPSARELQKARDELELRVAERTQQLKIANDTLTREAEERRRAEQESRESEARMRAVLDSTLNAVVVINSEGQITDWNARAETIFGWSRAEALGRDLGETIIPPQHREAHQRGMKRFLATGTGPMLNRLFELSAVRRDGSEFPVELTISPLRTGDTLTFCGFITDITARKQAEKDLRESQNLLQTVIDNSPTVIYAKDLQGRYLLVNRCFYELFHLDRENVIGKTDYDLFPKTTADTYRAMDARVAAANRALTEEEIAPLDDGPHTYVSVKCPLRDDAGKTYGIFGLSTDITDRKLAEDKIRSLNTELEQRVVERTAELESFSYSVSHDLRAPLRAMSGYARMLQEDLGTQLSPEAARKLERIYENANQMGQLIDGLLAFSRLSRQPVKKQKVLPTDIAQRVWDDLQLERGGRQIQFTIGTLPKCRADATLLHQVFANLISNALKYTRQKERATIEVGWDELHQAYFVTDNGAGFDMQYAGKLFGVFQRLHRADEFEGTGVGLAIVQRIVFRHGGKIWAHAEPDQGATFRFTLGEDDPNV